MTSDNGEEDTKYITHDTIFYTTDTRLKSSRFSFASLLFAKIRENFCQKQVFFFYSYLYKLDFTFWLCFTASSPSAEGTLLWREQPPTAHSCSLTTRRWSFDIEGGYRCTRTAFYSVLVYYSEPFKERSGILLDYLKNYSQTPFLAPLDYLCAFVAGQKYGSLGFISLFLMLRLVFCCTVLSFW